MNARACSHCRQIGHNIRSCNDEELANVWNNVLHMGDSTKTNYSHDDFAEQGRYLSCDISYRIVRAMAIRFCGARLFDLSYAIFDKIFISVKAKYAQWNTYWLSQSNNETVFDINELDDSIDLSDSIEIIDESNEEFVNDQYETKNVWIVQPLMFCLETEIELADELDCPICFDSIKKIQTLTTNCQHIFCKDCLCKHMDNHSIYNAPACPMCRTTIKTVEIKDIDFYDEIHEKYTERADTEIKKQTDELSVAYVDFLDSFEVFLQEIS